MNIEGKRSGEGFVTHRERLVSALSRAQAPKVEVIGVTVGRKGLLNYLRLLGGSNIVKIVPSNGDASGVRVAENGLKVVCGSNTSYLEDGAWLTEKIRLGDTCQIRVSPQNGVKPNLGGIELAEALSRVIPFAVGKKDERPVLQCIRFAQKEGKLTLASADGFRLAEATLDFEDGEGEALINAQDLKGIIPALKRAKRVKVGFEDTGLDRKALVIDTEAIRYRWEGEMGTYPDYLKAIPTEFVAEARFDTREMLRAVASLGALFLDRDAPIILSIKDGVMRLYVKDEKGEAQIEALATGEAKIAVNARYLAQALKALGGMAELKVKSPSAPMVFSVDGYRHVLMPMFVGVGKKEEEGKSEREAEAPTEATEGKVPTEPAEAVAEGKVETEHKPKRKQKEKEPVGVA